MNEENHMVMGEQYEESSDVDEREYNRDEDDYYIEPEQEDIVVPEFYYIPMELVDEMFHKWGKLNEAMTEIDDFLFDSIVEERNPIGEPE